MDSTDLTENFETGLFEGKNGLRFVRCEFNPSDPVWIDVTGISWSVQYAGMMHVIDWSAIDLPGPILLPIQQVVLHRLKQRAPSYIDSVRVALKNLAKVSADKHITLPNGFQGVGSSNWVAIWRDLDAHSRSTLRSLYGELAEKELAGANFGIAKEMSQWMARRDVHLLRCVTQWDAANGSFTSSEWELIRGALGAVVSDENDTDCSTRIFGRILDQTLKRPLQILSMPRNAFWTAPSKREFFLRIPRVKGQTGDKPKSWPITKDLAEDIRNYSHRLQIHKLQERFDRLIVMPTTQGTDAAWIEHGQVYSAYAEVHLRNWARRQRIVSPRTHQKVNLTPYRIRHTGATTMALQGVPRDQIQEVLEHDSPASADAYIQAVGSDLMPALERTTDRGVGKVFSELRDAYFFKGAVADNVGPRPIYIPQVQGGAARPAVVGSCGKAGVCTEHPFWACYNGCPHFLAWRDAPHHKSLQFVESELARWSDAERGKERSKLSKDFDRIGAAIREVISQVDRLKITDAQNKDD